MAVEVHSSAHIDPAKRIKELEDEVKQLKEELDRSVSRIKELEASAGASLSQVSSPGARPSPSGRAEASTDSDLDALLDRIDRLYAKHSGPTTEALDQAAPISR